MSGNTSDESFSSQSDGSSSSEDMFPHNHILNPYDFEPLASSSDEEENDDEEINKAEASLRINNTSWCKCSECQSMTTESESFCCVEDSKKYSCRHKRKNFAFCL